MVGASTGEILPIQIDSKTGIAGVGRNFVGQAQSVVIKKIRHEPHRLDVRRREFIQMHRLVVKIAQVEELDPKRQPFFFPQRLVLAELNLAVVVVSQLAQKIGQIGAWRMKRLMGSLLGLFGHVIKGDMHRLQPRKSEGWATCAKDQHQR